MTTRTIGFLPEIFRTATNQKFLNATLDQLITEPNFKKINGYVGRRFAPTFKLKDNYLPEPTTARQNYQLEPCVVVNDVNKNVNFLSSYTDLLQQIQHYGGIVSNHSRLFNNTAYSFDGLTDFDKLVNFSQYYWLPNGPDAVDVFAGNVDTSNTLIFTRDTRVSAYTVEEFGTSQNPDIVLARGGTYEFKVNQPGFKFWIQTNPGTAGTRPHQSNINTREVFGVTGNGSDNGSIVFTVPQFDAQDEFVNMPLVREVDFATTLNFSDIDHQLVQNLIAIRGGIDGVYSNLAGKYVVFISNDISDPTWDEKGVFDLDGYASQTFDDGAILPLDDRSGIWQIQLQDTGNGTQLIHLIKIEPIPANHKVFVKSGEQNANKEFYNTGVRIEKVPLITAPLSTLYYNDGTDQKYYGRIRLVSVTGYSINIETEILNKKEYTGPNGVKFTNGLKVRFGENVTPLQYADTEYYVEGVGKGIRLVKCDNLITPELEGQGASVPFDVYGFGEDMFDEILDGPLTPDYITINRSSVDYNAWSRSNRWFHYDVLLQTAEYNNQILAVNQASRAARPIIEFDADLELFNHGRIGQHSINVLDFTITDAFGNNSLDDSPIFEGSEVAYVDVAPLPSGDNTDDNITAFESANLNDGMTIVFANDNDPIVRNKIYRISILNITDEFEVTKRKVHLTPISEILINDNIVPTTGIYVPLIPLDPLHPETVASTTFVPSARQIAEGDHTFWSAELDGVVGTNVGLILGNSFWFDGATWVRGQQKAKQNLAPMFNIVDDNLHNFSDVSYYNTPTFKGCKIFSYKLGKGSNDSVLGFPLSYRNFANVGDIEFQNNFDTDVITEIVGQNKVLHKVNSGFAPKIVDRNTIKQANIWATKDEETKQYQIISNFADGVTQLFEIDILPEAVIVTPTIKVFVNNKLLPSDNYEIVSVGVKNAVNVLPLLVADDKVDILIYSDQTSALGFYEIPTNLDFNALNLNFDSLTLGQFRNHLAAMATNSSNVTGQVPGFSNVRDLDIKSTGGSILQHSAPALYSSLFLINKELNFIEASTLAQKEYSKFKNRFLESFAQVVDAGITDAAAGVDFILRQINAVKNNLSPWYYSDMVPYEQNKTVIDYTVIDSELVEYEIASIFNDTTLSNKAILVYLNGQQLTKGVDYSFNQARPSIIFVNSLQADDLIQIHTYHNTDGCFIPETPTKLGLYPKYTPSKFVDSTYEKPLMVIQGHDGSITPAFGDIRDELLLELEKRIYNNIKTSYNDKSFDIYTYIPGEFRKTEYSKAEFNRIVTRSFLNWVGSNRVDYSTNQWFAGSNPWSWTYNRFRSIIDHQYLPGHWRGIYKHFYDTDAPNERPWEMLGFSEQPNWWISTYGPAPYTGGNLVLWGDLEQGLIRFGDRAGIHLQYARPGLSKVIPVTDAGELRSPDQFLVTDFNSTEASGTFAIGDQAPVETAWRRSSDYPFAVQQALALMKPSKYFGLLANVQDYSNDPAVGQFIINGTKQRITPADFKINGDTSNASIIRSAGYLNWIADYITNAGANPVDQIQGCLNNIAVQLGYRVAGYTDKSYLKILAEQSSPSSTNESIVIPDENYRIHLHKSSPVDTVVYSAVIIEKTAGGYSVSGYDTQHPFFTIIPSEPNSARYQLAVSGATGTVYNKYQKIKVTIPYGHEFNNKQQVVDFLISYGRYLKYQGFSFEDFSKELLDTKNWELSAKEFLTWTQQGWAPGNIIVVSPVSNNISMNYDNAVVDVLDNAANGAKILDVGFNAIKNNLFSITRTGASFTLSTIPEITIGLLVLNLVQYEHVLVFDNETLFNDVVYKPELGNRQYRLKLIGNKTNGWTGQVNPPGFIFSNSQIAEWAPGQDYRKGDIVLFRSLTYVALSEISASEKFIQNLWKQIDASSIKTGLLPNFAYNAKKFENMYDIDNQVQDQDINMFSSGLIGHRERGYLSDLSLNSTTQAKFYQGYIRDKGTKDAVTALTSASFNNLAGDVQFNEEWAFRVGEYGALESNQFLEIQLLDKTFTHTPIAISLLDSGEVAENKEIVGVHKETLYKKPVTFKKNIFQNRDSASVYENDVRTAGYVNLDDIDATIFDIQNYQELDSVVSNVVSGYTIWVAKDITRDWNVYRADETQIRITNIVYELDSFVTLTTSRSHGLVAGDMFIVKGVSPEVDSFYVVTRTDTIDTIFAAIDTRSEATLKVAASYPGIEADGALYRLSSLRKSSLSAAADYTPEHGWITGDRIWVDTDTTDGKWAVYEKNSPWAYTHEIYVNQSEIVAGGETGASVAISEDGLIGVVGVPNVSDPDPNTLQVSVDNHGAVKVFVQKSSGLYAETVSLSINNPDILKFGFAVDLAQRTIVVGAPESNSTGKTASGKVAVYKIEDSGEVFLSQIIDMPDLVLDANFGYSVSLSKDAHWLYVGAPGMNKVYAFGLEEVEPQSQSISVVAGPAPYLYPLAFTPHSTMSVAITSITRVLVPNVDYVIHNQLELDVSGSPHVDLPLNTYGTYNYIEFLILPPAGSYTVVQNSYYDIVDSTIGSSITLNNGDRFGHTVKTQSDGTSVVVGSPHKSQGAIIRAGAAYLFNRYIQEFIGDGATNTFSLAREYNVSLLPKVIVNGVRLQESEFTYTSSTVTIMLAPGVGQKVRVETNHFDGSNGTQAQELKVPALYNAKFGTAVTISDSSKDIFVSAAEYNSSTYRGGIVYRFINEGQEFNTILTKEEVTDFSGRVVRINNRVVVLPSGNVTQIINAINAAKIVGLHASAEVNQTDYSIHLRLVYNAPTASDRLTLLSGDQSYQYEQYTNAEPQTIKHPFQEQSEKFGSKLCYDETSKVLLVASENSSIIENIQIDNFTTTLDGNTTIIFDAINDTGSVFLFEELSNANSTINNATKFGFVQQLSSDGIAEGDNFGSAVAMSKGKVFVGAKYSSSYDMSNTGSLHYFTNDTQVNGWVKIRSQQEKVDLDNLVRMYLYDKKSQTIMANLDYIDPAKGKILGVAEQDIAYKTSFDPANYNSGNSTTASIDPDYHWGAAQVGQVWWNLDKVRYLDYEQGTLDYRMRNWGRMFPGSTVEVYEWVESSTLPSAYSGEGTPLYAANEAYVQDTSIDTTGVIRAKYYFWVKGISTVNSSLNFRRSATTTITDLITSPHTQDIPYAILLQDNSLALISANSYIAASNTILHIDYALLQNANIVHNEYELIQENSNTAILPTKIVNKLVDSLTGADKFNNIVPDFNLTVAERYGISVRPRQTMVVDRLQATKNFVQYVNNVFAQYPIVELFDLSKLYITEESPATEEVAPSTWDVYPIRANVSVNTKAELTALLPTLIERQRILVKQDETKNGRWTIYQVAKDPLYLPGGIYYDEYDLTQHFIAVIIQVQRVITNTVETLEERSYLNTDLLVLGYYVLVKYDSNFNNQWATYEIIAKPWLANTTFSKNEIVFYNASVYMVNNNITTGTDFVPANYTLLTSDSGFKLAQTQSFNTADYWEKINWIDATYDATVNPTYTVETIKDISKLTLATGNSIYVKNNGSGQFAIYRTNDDLTTSLVGIEAGTIKLKDSLWSHDTNQIGFGNDSFDAVKYDLNPTTEFRNIISAIKEDIFIKSLDGQFNKMFFIMLNYIMSEQRTVDWAFKTSFVSILHKLRKLDQFPNYVRDNQSFYEDYINEVKPYRTKVREYLIAYNGQDDSNMLITDFSLPAYYDTDFNTWRQPSGEHARDELLLSTQPEYISWNNNHAYNIESVQVTDKGYGYNAPPALLIQGGGGTGAVLEAVVDYYTGSITKVNVINSGSGYTSTPKIVVLGDGVNNKGEQTCTLYPMMSNKVVRSFDTVIKFDRIGRWDKTTEQFKYDSIVKQWKADTDYVGGDIVAYNNKAYTVISTIHTGQTFNPAHYTVTPVDNTDNFTDTSAYQMTAADRVEAFYAPTIGMPTKNLARLFNGTEYPGNKVDGSNFIAPWEANIPYTIGTTVLHNGHVYKANATLLPAEAFNIADYTDLTPLRPTTPPNYDQPAFGELSDNEIDTQIESYFNDVALGTRPEDIDVVGGGFVDIYNSHAPEELLPGMMFDTLDIKVFQVAIDTNTYEYDLTVAPIGFRISKTMAIETPMPPITDMLSITKTVNGTPYNMFSIVGGVLVNNNVATLPGDTVVVGSSITFDHNSDAWEYRRMCESATTVLARDLNIEDAVIYVTDVSKLPVPGPALPHPGVIYINGEKITYYQVDLATNSLSQIRRGVWGTGAPAKHIMGTLVVDASLEQLIPGDAANTTWLNPDYNGSPTGPGLFGSYTEQADFIKQCATYLPWLPGEVGDHVDPNANHTRFDDDGLDQYNTPAHPYDQDPFDSYDAG
jgi:hypothetical protein